MGYNVFHIVAELIIHQLLFQYVSDYLILNNAQKKPADAGFLKDGCLLFFAGNGAIANVGAEVHFIPMDFIHQRVGRFLRFGHAVVPSAVAHDTRYM